MSLTPADVHRIARLARLDLSDADEATMRSQLNAFFDTVVERMRAVDTSGVAPLATPLAARREVALPLRDDAVTEAPDAAARAANLRNAPAVADGMVLVPRVIE